MSVVQRVIRLAVLIAVVVTSAQSARAVEPQAAQVAHRFISLTAGPYVPYRGEPGMSFGIRVGHGVGDRTRLGGEFEFRDYEGRILGVDDVRTRSYSGRLVLEFQLYPDAVFNPYIGLGAGFSFLNLKADNAEFWLPGSDPTRSHAGGLEGIVVLGFRGKIPRASALSIVGELRFSNMITGSRVQFEDDNKGWRTRYAGGVSLHAALQFAF